MNTEKLSLVPLQQATLCMDCEMITAAHTRCFACGSAALLNIAKALNGDEYAEPMQPELVTVTSIPVRHIRQTKLLYASGSQANRNHGSIGELVAFPPIHSDRADGSDSELNTWWGSFQEVAAIVQRAMTFVVFVVLLFGAAAKAQSGAGMSAQAAVSLDTTLSKSLDSKKVICGYPVVARTTQTVRIEGNISLPKGTQIIGHVVKASARAKGAYESVLGIRFDHAILKNGREILLSATIQTIASAPSEAKTSGSDDAPGMTASGSATAGGGMQGVVPTGGRTPGGVASSATGFAGSSAGVADPRLIPAAYVTQMAGGAAGLNAGGGVTPDARNVIGMRGVRLSSSADGRGAEIASAGKSVRLESGTHFVLALEAGVAENSGQ